MTDMKDQMRQAVASVSVGRKEHRDHINIDVLLQPQRLSQSQCPAPLGVRQSLSAVRCLFNDGLSSLPIGAREVLQPGEAIHIRTTIHWTAAAARPEQGPAAGFSF
jgi:hypothetical protein